MVERVLNTFNTTAFSYSTSRNRVIIEFELDNFSFPSGKPLSCRNQSIDLQSKFLYDSDLRYERVNLKAKESY